MSKAWPLVTLGEVLKKSEESVQIDPHATYREVTIKLWGKGVVLRREASGSEIAAPRRSVVRAGQFILSRIDARNGAFGVVPPALDGAVVSNDFPSYNLNPQRIIPEYLGWLSRSAVFVDLCKAASEGTTNRVRLKEEKFLATAIALPPLAEQQRIVARIEELAVKIEEARGLRRQAMEETVSLSRSTVEAVYQDLIGRFGLSTLADACTSITDGDHNTPSFSESGVRFIFVGNVSSGKLHFDNSKRVAQDYFKSLKPHRVPERGDILYSAVGATLGIPAVVETDEPFCFQRHIAILKPDRERIDSRYIWHMLRSQTAFKTAWATTTGTAQPTVPLRAIKEIPVPLPAIPDQRRFVAYLDNLQAKVDSLKHIHSETAAELNALLPSILDKAFQGDLA
jgi:type I restriction enzyme S subunit